MKPLLAGLLLLRGAGPVLPAEPARDPRAGLYLDFDGPRDKKSAPGPIERKLYGLRPVLQIGLAGAGIAATLGTPAAFGFAAVALVNGAGLAARWLGKRKRARSRAPARGPVLLDYRGHGRFAPRDRGRASPPAPGGGPDLLPDDRPGRGGL